MNKIVVMFPGQASQFVGMGKTWYQRYESVRRRFAEAREVLGIDVAPLCLEGPARLLNQTENTQVALLTLSLAMYDVIQKEEGLQPSYIAGHSIGELTALTASGVFSFTDAIRLARVRGEAMASCDTGSGAGMVAVTNLKESVIDTVVSTLDSEGYNVQIANYNSPTQTVLSGSTEGLKVAGEQLKKLGAKVIPLNVSGPFHSRYMSSAGKTLAQALDTIQLGVMSIPVMCGHEGRLYTEEDDIKLALVKQLTEPVRWTTVLTELAKEGVSQWLEIGPKDVLKNLTLQTIPGARVYAYDDEKDLEAKRTLQENMGAADRKTSHLIGLCLGAAVATRNRNWDETEYQQGVVAPYKKIEAIYEKVELEKRTPTMEEMSQALSLLRVIFETKRTPHEEQSDRIRQILEKTSTKNLFPEYAS